MKEFKEKIKTSEELLADMQKHLNELDVNDDCEQSYFEVSENDEYDGGDDVEYDSCEETVKESYGNPIDEEVMYDFSNVDQQFLDAFVTCRDIFIHKLKDYGASWRIMRPQSVTDQIYIKANRIRSIEESGVTLVGDGIYGEFQAIVNYGIIALIQLELGYSNTGWDLSYEDCLGYYDKYMKVACDLMTKKNHDYGEAWKMMRTCSYTDLILMKICRTKQIESNNGKTIISEGIDSNYLDMINYAIFGVIKLSQNV